MVLLNDLLAIVLHLSSVTFMNHYDFDILWICIRQGVITLYLRIDRMRSNDRFGIMEKGYNQHHLSTGK